MYCRADATGPVGLVLAGPIFCEKKGGVTSCVLFIVLECENIDVHNVCIHACLLSVRAGQCLVFLTHKISCSFPEEYK